MNSYLKFIAHKTFNNKHNQLHFREKWTLELIFKQIELCDNSLEMCRYWFDILSNLSGTTTDIIGFNYTTIEGTSLQVLPFTLKSDNHISKPVVTQAVLETKDEEDKPMSATTEQIERLILYTKNWDPFVSRYAIRCLLNFSCMQEIKLTAPAAKILLRDIKQKDELTQIYIYGFLHNCGVRGIHKQYEHIDIFSKTLSSHISRDDLDIELKKYKTQSLWRWFWSLFGLMNPDSGTIFCLKNLLMDNPNKAQFNHDEICQAINNPSNYDGQKNNRFSIFKMYSNIKPVRPMSHATDEVISKINQTILNHSSSAK